MAFAPRRAALVILLCVFYWSVSERARKHQETSLMSLRQINSPTVYLAEDLIVPERLSVCPGDPQYIRQTTSMSRDSLYLLKTPSSARRHPSMSRRHPVCPEDCCLSRKSLQLDRTASLSTSCLLLDGDELLTRVGAVGGVYEGNEFIVQVVHVAARQSRQQVAGLA